jgi:type 1 glutamine amidotransferase
MKSKQGKTFFALIAALLTMLSIHTDTARAEDKVKALIIDGQNNHGWQVTTPILKAGLESSGRFTVDVATTAPSGTPADFKPDFSKYNVIVLNYNGADWPEETKKAFEDYMKNGGGMVSVHAADNAFPGWVEYNKMIGVGGWNGRNDNSGSMLRWRDGKIVRDHGGHGQHGAFFSWDVETRDAEHPIMQGLPEKWLHTPDELYSTLVGPAENVTVLATAKSDSTGQNEPILMTISYGKGRVFHTTMGHNDQSMHDVGFITTLDRGAEWAATGKVTIPVPANFPTADKTSIWTGK